MVIIVVGEHGQWEVSVLTPFKIQHTSQKHILEHLDRPLTLSIDMRMVCCTKMQLSTQLLMKIPPKPRGKKYLGLKPLKLATHAEPPTPKCNCRLTSHHIYYLQ